MWEVRRDSVLAQETTRGGGVRTAAASGPLPRLLFCVVRSRTEPTASSKGAQPPTPGSTAATVVGTSTRWAQGAGVPVKGAAGRRLGPGQGFQNADPPATARRRRAPSSGTPQLGQPDLPSCPPQHSYTCTEGHMPHVEAALGSPRGLRRRLLAPAGPRLPGRKTTPSALPAQLALQANGEASRLMALTHS